MRFRESHVWVSECDRVRIKRERKRYEVSTRTYNSGAWFFNGRFDSLAEAKKFAREHIKMLENL